MNIGVPMIAPLSVIEPVPVSRASPKSVIATLPSGAEDQVARLDVPVHDAVVVRVVQRVVRPGRSDLRGLPRSGSGPTSRRLFEGRPRR